MAYSRPKTKSKSHKGPDGIVLQPNAHAGDFRFRNLNAITQLMGNDETWIGNPWPRFTYGITINLGYKVLDLMAFLPGSVRQ